MIYADGSKSFFDIEGEFSKLVNEQNRNTSYADYNSLYSGISKYYGINKENIQVGCSIEELLVNGLNLSCNIFVPEFDYMYDTLLSVGKNNINIIKKNDEMIFKPSTLNIGDDLISNSTIVLSNPCFPSSLALSKSEIILLAKLGFFSIVIDESYNIKKENSLFELTNSYDNIIVIKKEHFSNEIVIAAGKKINHFIPQIANEKINVASVLFEHYSAFKTAETKISNSIDSLFSRMKKLAIKSDIIEKIFRTKANFVTIKISNTKNLAEKLYEKGIKVGFNDSYIWIFSCNNIDNNYIIEILSTIL